MFLRRSLACALAAISVCASAAEAPSESEPPAKASWALEVSGFSHHSHPPSGRLAVKEWNEQNWGLGLEYRHPLKDGYWVKGTGGVLLDSTDVWSAYFGAVLQKRVIDGTFSVDLGVGTFLFYRGFESGKKAWIAAPLPVISVEHEPSGVGLNLSFIPKFKTSRLSSPTTFFIQGVYRF